jgi:tetrahydromethanopterin S-methyltransferase subunit E
MVYCSRCGTQNPDDAKNCSNCGAPLYTVGQQYPGSEREHYKRMENECFGLPNGGMIVGVIFGIIILFAGVGLFLESSGIVVSFWSYLWPLIVIIFGLLIVAGALFKRRRYNQ